MNPTFFIAFLVSLLFSGVVAAALVTYVVRTWQVIRSERDGSLGSETLDRLDRIEARLDMLMERSEPAGGGVLPPGTVRKLEEGDADELRTDEEYE